MKKNTSDPVLKFEFSLSEFITKCQESMSSHGLLCNDELVLNGEIQRYSADNDPNKTDEWYIGDVDVLSEGEPILTCTYGSWSTGEKFTYRSLYSEEVSTHELKKHRDFVEIRRITQELEKKKGYKKIAQQLSLEYKGSKTARPKMNSIPWHSDDTRYLKTKNIKQYECDHWPIKFHKYIDSGVAYRALVIPIINIDNELRSVEYIYYKNDKCIKMLHTGGEKKGNFYPIDGINDFYPFRGNGFCYSQGHIPLFNPRRDPNNIKQLYIVEGYGTGASVFEALKAKKEWLEYCVIVALDAGNIPDVVGNLRTKFYLQKITICTDDDEAGNKYADKACRMYNCEKISIKGLD